MSLPAPSSDHWSDPLRLLFWRIAASGALPARWFTPPVPGQKARAAKTGKLKIEIVSHCWNYSHFLVYQLSSLALSPPTRAEVTMTVFYCEDDQPTRELLEHFSGVRVEGVTWNWQKLPKGLLFRRAVGRNQAALATRADWIWFTDCDTLFRSGCLDHLSDLLQGRNDLLVYPTMERVTPMLRPDDPLLQLEGEARFRLVDIGDDHFVEETVTRAFGPMQITHGDVARACGYCKNLKFFHQPTHRWCKTHEDRAFRWLLGAGRGVGIDLPGIYRIKHQVKGRYDAARPLSAKIRAPLHRLSDVVKGALRGKR